MKNLVVSSGAALPVKYFLEFEAKLGGNLKNWFEDDRRTMRKKSIKFHQVSTEETKRFYLCGVIRKF